jgi:selenocysteine lyase/cysteine desulfurase
MAMTSNFPAERLLDAIRGSVIGEGAVIDGPFGQRRLVYADYTASGRSVGLVEDVIREHVLPMYGNTHTDASAAGRQTTVFREDARRLIHRAVNGGDEDAVVFCGSGATGAIARLVQVPGLVVPSGMGAPAGQRNAARAAHRPVVFVGPYEHHSNELPWRESAADLVTIPEDADGRIDLTQLGRELRRFAGRPLKIGSFSAASNVTGIITDVDRVAGLLHRHGALACFDYAAAGPYLPIDMNPSPDRPGGELAYKDAVFLWPHKFVGGPGTPGVLVAKRALFANQVPGVPGGGTVLYVSPSRHTYSPDPEVREEGGTPAIVESIRAGLVFALKEAVGTAEIRRREDALVRRALAAWSANPRIQVLGNPHVERLAIISFGIRHPRGLLHSNFVVTLLSDLFGIQARSGCFCAGPYLHRLYPIDGEWSERMHAEAVRGHLGARLSFVRVSFTYLTSTAVLDYIIEAVQFLAEHGWKLLPLYRFDPGSGSWEHCCGPRRPALRLADLSARLGMPGRGTARMAGAPEKMLAGYLERARRIVAGLDAAAPLPAGNPWLTPEFERARWFPVPTEG